MKIVSIIGARPQFIKAAILSTKLRQWANEVLLHTGQHYDDTMSQIFFDQLSIPSPDIHLNIGSGTHAEQTGRMLIEIGKVLLQERPDWCLVYGDTNSTVAGALAAVKLHIRTAHVEAGLRSFNKSMPEEINRVVCDHISDALFCPTVKAAEQLSREGVATGVHIVGDVMGDLYQQSIAKAQAASKILEQIQVAPKTYALVTIHRASNTDDPRKLRVLLDTLSKLGRPVVFPVHPRTYAAIQNNDIAIAATLKIIEPVGYLDMLQLEANADCILTDSGGVQKEAYWAGVRCLTLREDTEWVETVETGWNRLVGVTPDLIISSVAGWQPQGVRPDIYGDGHAADKISEILKGL